MDNDREIALSEKQNFNKGVIVSSVLPDSPSAKQNIQAGDIFISINGKDIKDAKSFSRQIAESKIGSEIVLRIWQNMQIKDINLKIAQMPEIKKEAKKLQGEKNNDIPQGYIAELGLIVKNENNSVIIEDLLSDSDMSLKGLKQGDIIVKINNKETTSVEDVKAYIDYAIKNNDNAVTIDVLVDKIPQTIKVSITPND